MLVTQTSCRLGGAQTKSVLNAMAKLDPGAEVWPIIAAGDEVVAQSGATASLRVWLRDVEGTDLLTGTATVEVPDGLR